MSNPPFHLPDEPSDLSLRVLTLSLRSDCEKKGVSPKNYAHRSRVIRQQTELLARVTHSGTVQSFNDASGRGSIRPDDGGSDVGFETSDLSVAGMGSPKVGSRLTYHLSGQDGDANAVDVRRVSSPPSDEHSTTFTILRSVAEELAMKRDVDVWNNEGGHMSSSSGLVVSTPGSALPYKAILSHQGRNDSEHPFLTVREAEAFIRRNTPVPPARRTSIRPQCVFEPGKGARRLKMGKFKIAIVRRGQEARWREYWIASASKGTADDAPSGLGRTEVVEAATLAEAVKTVERMHPDCTVMLAGGEHRVA